MLTGLLSPLKSIFNLSTIPRINNGLFCVLGREGGLKVQRKFGDIFLLHLRFKVIISNFQSGVSVELWMDKKKLFYF